MFAPTQPTQSVSYCNVTLKTPRLSNSPRSVDAVASQTSVSHVLLRGIIHAAANLLTTVWHLAIPSPKAGTMRSTSWQKALLVYPNILSNFVKFSSFFVWDSLITSAQDITSLLLFHILH